MFRCSFRTLVLCLITLLAPFAAASASARGGIGNTTFYVSPTGSDWHSGRSPAHAWRTVSRVNEARLKPGDRVLFRAGATFGDDTLMPGWGNAVSGTRRAPVVFGSYESGRASLPQGIWIKGERHLVFQDLKLGPDQGISGTGSHDTVKECGIRDLMGSTELGVDVIGSHWVIRDNSINRTGDSGMLLRGDHFAVLDNVITNTGLDPGITYGSHGIYLKAWDSSVVGNIITHFRNDGVSVRYRNSFVYDNTISGGDFGIAWFQYDLQAGTSVWMNNTISHSGIAGIYVSPSDRGGRTREHFVIKDNRIYKPSGRRARVATSRWTPFSLSRGRGRYLLRANAVL